MTDDLSINTAETHRSHDKTCIYRRICNSCLHSYSRVRIKKYIIQKCKDACRFITELISNGYNDDIMVSKKRE